MTDFKEGDILISKIKSKDFSENIRYVVRNRNGALVIKPVIYIHAKSEHVVLDNDWLEFPLNSEHFEKVGVEKRT